MIFYVSSLAVWLWHDEEVRSLESVTADTNIIALKKNQVAGLSLRAISRKESFEVPL